MPFSPDDPWCEDFSDCQSCFEELTRAETPLPSYAPQRVTQSRITQPPCHAESPSTESSGRHRLPLDELLEFASDTSDGEMEEITPGNTTTTTTPSPASRPAKTRCCWEGCKVEFGAWAYESVWANHIRSAHLGQEEEGRGRRSKMINCGWDGCDRKMKPERIVEHIKKAHLEVVEDSTSP